MDGVTVKQEPTADGECGSDKRPGDRFVDKQAPKRAKLVEAPANVAVKAEPIYPDDVDPDGDTEDESDHGTCGPVKQEVDSDGDTEKGSDDEMLDEPAIKREKDDGGK